MNNEAKTPNGASKEVKIVETEEGLTCYFDSKDWSNTAQAKCSLYYSDTDGNKISNKTLYITF